MITFRKKNIRARNSGRAVLSFRAHLLKGILSIVSTAIVVYGIYAITRLDAFTIRSVVVEGGETISHDDVRAKVESGLAGNYLGLVPKRFMLTYPYESILESIQKVPRIHRVDITTNDSNELVVVFDEYVPYALWCMYNQPDAPCYFLSADGFAFAEAPMLHGGAFMRHFTESTAPLAQGYVLDGDMLANIEWFVRSVETDLGMRISSMLHKNNKDIELMVSGGGAILIASDKDVHSTYENLKSVLSSEEYKHLAPGNFKYVDVRFDTKVFVNEQLTPVVQDVATSTSEYATGTAKKLPE